MARLEYLRCFGRMCRPDREAHVHRYRPLWHSGIDCAHQSKFDWLDVKSLQIRIFVFVRDCIPRKYMVSNSKLRDQEKQVPVHKKPSPSRAETRHIGCLQAFVLCQLSLACRNSKQAQHFCSSKFITLLLHNQTFPLNQIQPHHLHRLLLSPNVNSSIIDLPTSSISTLTSGEECHLRRQKTQADLRRFLQSSHLTSPPSTVQQTPFSLPPARNHQPTPKSTAVLSAPGTRQPPSRTREV